MAENKESTRELIAQAWQHLQQQRNQGTLPSYRLKPRYAELRRQQFARQKNTQFQWKTAPDLPAKPSHAFGLLPDSESVNASGPEMASDSDDDSDIDDVSEKDLEILLSRFVTTRSSIHPSLKVEAADSVSQASYPPASIVPAHATSATIGGSASAVVAHAPATRAAASKALIQSDARTKLPVAYVSNSRPSSVSAQPTHHPSASVSTNCPSPKPVQERSCINCESKQTSSWLHADGGAWECLPCYVYRNKHEGRQRPKQFQRNLEQKRAVQEVRGARPSLDRRDEYFSGSQEFQAASVLASTTRTAQERVPVCRNCRSSAASAWHRREDGERECSACWQYYKGKGHPRPENFWGKEIIRRNRASRTENGNISLPMHVMQQSNLSTAAENQDRETRFKSPRAKSVTPDAPIIMRCPFWISQNIRCTKVSQGNPYRSLCAHIQSRHPEWHIQHNNQTEDAYRQMIEAARSRGCIFSVSDPFQHEYGPIDVQPNVSSSSNTSLDPHMEPTAELKNLQDLMYRRSKRMRAAPVNYFDASTYPGGTIAEASFALETPPSGGPLDHAQSLITPLGMGGFRDERLEAWRKRLEMKSKEASLTLSTERDDALATPTRLRVSRKLSAMHSRELGLNRVLDVTSVDYRRWKKWHGASHDILELDWNPDGTRFVAGAAAQGDYNKRGNLIIGDLVRNSITELPEHFRIREATATHSSSREYTTISKVQWLADGDHFLSASYDRTVKLWDATHSTKVSVIGTFERKSEISTMAISPFHDTIATGIRDGIDSVNVVKFDSSNKILPPTTAHITFRGTKGRSDDLVPSTLAWGSGQGVRNHLVAGFSRTDDHDWSTPKNGHLGLWRFDEGRPIPILIQPWGQNIFDTVWHNSLPILAVGCAVGVGSQITHPDTRSVVRLYEPLGMSSRTLELECPAVDINNITFCPQDTNYVTAGCTDAVTYVWDCRKHNQILHRLPHGPPISPINEDLPLELSDVGVRASLWGQFMSEFFTGSSDGKLRHWDIRLSGDDVWVRDVDILDSAIMAAAFSPDKSHLLIGSDTAKIQILSKAPFDGDDNSDLTFESAKIEEESNLNSMEGILKAREFIENGELEMDPVYGPGKGKNYDQFIGPKNRPLYADWARHENIATEDLPTAPLKDEVRLLQLRGPSAHRRDGLSEDQKKRVKRTRQTAFAFSGMRPKKNKARNSEKRTRGEALASTLSSDNLIAQAATTSAFSQAVQPLIIVIDSDDEVQYPRNDPSDETDVSTDESDEHWFSAQEGNSVKETGDGCFPDEDNFFPPNWLIDANFPVFPTE